MRTEFGQRLLEARKGVAKLTQVQLAKAVGMSQANYAELEKSGQGSAYTPKIASVCGVNVEWLAYGTGEMLATKLSPFIRFQGTLIEQYGGQLMNLLAAIPIEQREESFLAASRLLLLRVPMQPNDEQLLLARSDKPDA